MGDEVGRPLNAIFMDHFDRLVHPIDVVVLAITPRSVQLVGLGVSLDHEFERAMRTMIKKSKDPTDGMAAIYMAGFEEGGLGHVVDVEIWAEDWDDRKLRILYPPEGKESITRMPNDTEGFPSWTL